MHRLLALVVVVGCNGSAPAPERPTSVVAPPPAPMVALTDPCDGGETKADPCAGGEAPQQVAIADPCDGGEATGGLGMRGTGLGGGGTGEGTVGIGTVGTIGHGGGVGKGTGYGAGAPGSGSRDPAKLATVAFGKPTITGELHGVVVSRVARRHLNQVRYCYERALAKDPSLKGTVTLELEVTAEGAVSDAEATGLHAEVHECLAAVARRWSFPPSKGAVTITLPIRFAPPSGT